MADVLVAVPTRGRAAALDRALASIAPQVTARAGRLLVVLDGADPAAAAVAEAHGAELAILDPPRGANAARNRALDAMGDTALLVLCDDDVEAPPGWLDAHLAGAAAHPGHEVLGGPIRPRLEGVTSRACGREPAPITALDLGPSDADVPYVWSANLALRPAAILRAGRFDERIHGRGEEEEWLDRFAAAGGRVRYLAGAGLHHIRSGPEAGPVALARAQYHLGRSARANDVRKATAPGLGGELRGLAGGVFHLLGRRCSFGLAFVAHALGRLVELVDPSPRPPDVPLLPPPPAEEDFVSGQSGYVAGVRLIARARVRDTVLDLAARPRLRRLDADVAAWAARRHVVVAALERTDVPNLLDAALAELGRSAHALTVLRAPAADRGRFENLNRLLATAPDAMDDADWLLVVDDDVALPPRFLDRFVFLAERHGLVLAQPAHRAFSHAAWAVTRRRAGSVLRETAFVEIGPLLAVHRSAFDRMLPFPEPRIGWGVDAWWGALARAEGWRIGIVDATPIAHRLRPVAAAYDHSAALAESRAFLASHPHLTVAEATRTLRTHPSW